VAQVGSTFFEILWWCAYQITKPIRRMPKALGMVLIVLISLSAGYILRGGPKSASSTSSPGSIGTLTYRDTNPDAPVPVTASRVERKDVPIFLTGIGTVNAYNSVAVKAREDGQLIAIKFTEGQEVKVGDVLAVIDQRPYLASLKQAEAALAKDQSLLANAKLDLDRDVKLGEYTSHQSVDTQKSLVEQYQAQVESDAAQVDSARTNYSYTTITAPIDGRTGIRGVDIGNIVHAADTTAIVTVTQLQPISVVFTLPADDLSIVSKGIAQQPLTVMAYSKDNERSLGEGKLVLVDNQIDSTTGTVKLKATFANADRALWPGQFVNARLLVDTAHGGLVVPASAVQRGPNGAYVWVIGSDSKVIMRPITVQQVQDGVALVAQGLTEGESVVVDGQYKLQPGSKIQQELPSAAQPNAGPA
jgi:multidrug efflux system membrane fusion protein